MPSLSTPISPLDLVAHVIQVALTPVFLLSGIATLLNVFSTRLARRRSDREGDGRKRRGRYRGTWRVPVASAPAISRARCCRSVLGAVAGGLTCASVLTLFVGALKEATVASVLFTTFGLAVISTIGAIGAFAAEMLMAGSGMRAEVAAAHRSSQPR